MSTEVCRHWSRSFPSERDVTEFFAELTRQGVAEVTVEVFQERARCSAAVRLRVNITEVLKQLEREPVEDVLWSLSEKQRKALMELQVRGVSLRGLEIAHGLLNVHERWVTKRSFTKLFHEARKHK